jgi:hypothetical protein
VGGGEVDVDAPVAVEAQAAMLPRSRSKNRWAEVNTTGIGCLLVLHRRGGSCVRTAEQYR